MAKEARSKTRHLLRDESEAVRPPPPPPPALPDAEFFHQMVKRYQALVFKYVFQLVRDHHLTQDLSQEVFLKVYRRFHLYDTSHVLSTWLLKVAHNHVLDYLKKRRLRTVSMEQPSRETGVPLLDCLPRAHPDAAELMEARECKDAIEEAIAEMPVDQRGVLVLRYLEGRKLQEIAYILEVPLGTVKSRIQRSRGVLQRKLRETL